MSPIGLMLNGYDDIWHNIFDFMNDMDVYVNNYATDGHENFRVANHYPSIMLSCKHLSAMVSSFKPFLFLAFIAFLEEKTNKVYSMPSLKYFTSIFGRQASKKLDQDESENTVFFHTRLLENVSYLFSSRLIARFADPVSRSETVDDEYLLHVMKCVRWRVDQFLRTSLMIRYPRVAQVVNDCNQIHQLLSSIPNDCSSGDGSSIPEVIKQLQPLLVKYRDFWRTAVIRTNDMSISEHCFQKEWKEFEESYSLELVQEFCLASISASRHSYWGKTVPTRFHYNREFILKLVSVHYSGLRYVYNEFKTDKQVVLAAVRANSAALECATKEMRADSQIVYTAACSPSQGPAILFASEELQKDKKLILMTIRRYPEYIRNLTDPDRSFILEHALNVNPQILEFLSKELRDDKCIVLKSVERDGRVLKHATERLRGDKDVVLAAVGNWKYAMRYASEELQGDRAMIIESGYIHRMIQDFENDREVTLIAMKNAARLNLCAKHVPPVFRNDREIMLEAVINDYTALDLAGEDLQNDREFVLEAVRRNGRCLHFTASKKLFRIDKEIVLVAVRQTGYALVYAPKELKKDREVVSAAVKSYCFALEYAPDELKHDRELVLCAIRSSPNAFEYVPDVYKSDREVRQIAIDHGLDIELDYF